MKFHTPTLRPNNTVKIRTKIGVKKKKRPQYPKIQYDYYGRCMQLKERLKNKENKISLFVLS